MTGSGQGDRGRRKVEPRDRRMASRLQVSLEVGVKETPLCIQRVTLVDISTIGCRLHTGFALKPNLRTAVIVNGFEPMRATVVWYRSGDAGLHFVKRLHPSVVSYLVSQSASQRSLEACILRSFLGEEPAGEKQGVYTAGARR
jgi:hypothetical protein